MSEPDNVEIEGHFTEEEQTQLRIAQADSAVSSWIARQLAAWAAEYQETTGKSLAMGDAAKPILAGATAALARFNWDVSREDVTVDEVASEMDRVYRAYLNQVAAGSPPGAFARLSKARIN